MKWIIGLAAGAAVYYLLRTEKGKDLINSVKDQASSLGDTLCDLTGNLFKAGKDVADKAGAVV